MGLQKFELQPWILDLVLANGRQLLERASTDHGTSTIESKNNTIAPRLTKSKLVQVVQFEGTRKPPFGRVVISDSFTSIIASLSESARRKYEKINDVRLPSLTEGAIWELSQYSLTFTSRPEVILEIHDLKLKGEQCSAVRGNPSRTGDEESVQQLFSDMKSFPNKAKSGPDPATPSQMNSQEEPMSQNERDSDEDAIATQVMRRKIHSAGHGLAAVNQQQQLLEVLLRKQGKNDTNRDQGKLLTERQSLTPARVSQITKMNPEGQPVGEVGENLVKNKSRPISRKPPSPRIDGHSNSSRHASDQSQARFGSDQPSTEQSHSRTTTPRAEELRLPRPVPRRAERPGLYSNSSFKRAAGHKGQGPAGKPAVKDVSSKGPNMALSETFTIGQKLLRNKFVAPPKPQLQFLQSSATYVDPTRKGDGQSINLPPHILQELKEYHLSKSVPDAHSSEGQTEGPTTRENAAVEPENVMSEYEGREVSISQRLPSHPQEKLGDRLDDHSVTQSASSEAGSEMPWSSSPVRLPPQPPRAAPQRESSLPLEEYEDEITIQKPSSPHAEGSNILQSQEIASQTSLMDGHVREVQSPKSVQLSAITRSCQFSSITSQHMSSSQPSMDYELDIGLPLALDARSSSPMPEMSSPTRFQTQLEPLILPQPPTVQIARSPFRPAPEESSRSVLHGTRHTDVSDSRIQTSSLDKRVLSSDPVIPATCVDTRKTIASVETQNYTDEHMEVSAEPSHSAPEYTILVPGTCQHGDPTASSQQNSRPSGRGEEAGAPASPLLQNDRSAVTSPDDMLMGAQPAKVVAPSTTVSTDTSPVSGHRRNSETSKVAAKQVRSNKFRLKAPDFSQIESAIDTAELAKANRRSFVSEETSCGKELARSDVAQVEAGDTATDAEDVGAVDTTRASQVEKSADTARPDSTSSNATPVARQRTVSVINHEEKPGNEATVVVSSPVPPPNEGIFERFSKAYPEYSHGERGFIRGCCYIDWLRSQPKMRAPHPSHFDDVIRTYLGPYAAYMKERRARGLKYQSAMDYFDNDVVEPLFTKRIVTAQTLGQALTVNLVLTCKYRETLRRCSLPGSAKVTPVQRKRPADGIEYYTLMHVEIPEDRLRLGTAQRDKGMNGPSGTDAVGTYYRPGLFVDEPRNTPTTPLKAVPEANAKIDSPRLSYPVMGEHATSPMPAVQVERTIIEQVRPTATFESTPKSSERTQRRRSRVPWSALKSTQGIAKSPTPMARLRTPVEELYAGRASMGSHSASWAKATVVNSSPSEGRAAMPNVGNSLTQESRIPMKETEETLADITSQKRLSTSRMKPTTLISPIIGGRVQTPMKVEPGNDLDDLYGASPPRIQAPETVKNTLPRGTVVKEDMASPEHSDRALEMAKATRTPDVTATAIDPPEALGTLKETPRSISTAATPSDVAPAALETAASCVLRKKKRKSGLTFIDETTLETAKQYVPRKKKRKSGLTFLGEPVEL